MLRVLPLAAATSTLDRLQKVPASAWWRIAAAVGGLALLVIVLRKILKINKVVLGIVVLLVVTTIGFNWIYERNEPSWASPVVEWLATFLPTKNSMK